MKRFSFIVTIIILSLFAFSAVAAELKIGVVNIEMVMAKYSEGIKVTKQLDAKLEVAIKEVQKKKEQLINMKESLERDAGKLSLPELKERQRKLENMNLEYARMAQDHLRQLQKKELELGRKIKMDIAKMVSLIAKEEGYTIILVNPTSGILYASGTVDLTAKTIKKLNGK
jgi:outer membrane protein